MPPTEERPQQPFAATEVLGEVIGFRPYDEALQRFFTKNFFPDPKNPSRFEVVKPVIATPRREYGTQEAFDPTMDTGEFSDENPARVTNQTLRLPAASLSQHDWTLDVSRWTRAHYRKLGRSEDGRRVMQSVAPLPFTVMYQLDLWTKYKSHMNQLLRSMLLPFFAREVWLDVNLGGPWGVQPIALDLDTGAVKNLVAYDPDTHERTERRVITVWLDAWIIPDPVMIPTVRKVFIQEYLATRSTTTLPDPSELPPYSGWLLSETTVIVDSPTSPTSPNP